MNLSIKILLSIVLLHAGMAGLFGLEKTGADCNPNESFCVDVDGYNGVTLEQFKLGFGPGYHEALGSESYLFTMEFEYQVSQYFGFVGEAGFPISSNKKDAQVYPGNLGFNLHMFPYNPVDLYVGGKGGFTYVHPVDAPQALMSAINLHTGLSFYFAQVMFVQAEVGYDFTSYAKKEAVVDYSTPRASFKIGFFI